MAQARGPVRAARTARRDARARPSPALAPYVAALLSVGLVVSVFLPWYATDLGPPFAASSVSGWDATAIARAALGLAAAAALAAGALALEGRGSLVLEPRTQAALAWLGLAAAAAAAALVAYRLLLPPDPADLLSRQAGLYLATGAGAGAVAAAWSALVARR